MEQTKVFYGFNGLVTHSQTLEQAMNEWLSKMGDTIEVTRVAVGASGHVDNRVTVVIFYKKIN